MHLAHPKLGVSVGLVSHTHLWHPLDHHWLFDHNETRAEWWRHATGVRGHGGKHTTISALVT